MKRKGYFLIELALALALFTALFFSAYKFYTINRNVNTLTEADKNAQVIANGIFKNFSIVVDAYKEVCAPDGWISPNCAGTNPFPYADGVGHRIYYTLGGALTALQKQQLAKRLEENLLPACRFQTSSGNNYYFICTKPIVDGIDYVLNDGVIQTGGYTAGLVNSRRFPVAIKIHFSVDLPNGGRVSKTQEFNESWLYEKLKLETQKRFLTIANAMKKYAQTRLITETELRSYPNGLPSADDVYIPWIWESMMAPDTSLADPYSVIYTACADSNCTNITRDINHWTPYADYPFVVNRLVRNLIVKDSGTLVPWCYDAFMNPVRIIPVANGCGADLTTCNPALNVPPRPQLNYYSVYFYRPPYFGYIFSPFCAGADAPSWCKVKVIY